MSTMTDWDGRGTPPAVAARVARHARHPVVSGYTGPGGMAALTAAGLELVGEVFGTSTLATVGLSYNLFCSQDQTPVVVGIARQALYPYTRLALFELGYANALSRLLAEATGMDADGVIGVTVSSSPKFVEERAAGSGQAEVWAGLGPEFTAKGTAVRWRNPALRGPRRS